jgi:Transposase Tn5 dimerisation domain
LKKALQILALYTVRWQIEVFHRILKSGCQVEDYPPEDIQRLRPRLAVQMILAWRIHYVTLVGRECPELPAEVVFEEWEWKPLVVVFCGKSALLQPPRLAQMIAWIAKLGGYIGRKGDGPAGPQTIWKGMAKMLAYGELWRALHDLPAQISSPAQPP